MPTAYPTEFKTKAIRRYEKGESIKPLSEEPHISQSTLYQWRKDCCSIETPNRTYTPKEFDAICGRIAHDAYTVVIGGKESMRKRKGLRDACQTKGSTPFCYGVEKIRPCFQHIYEFLGLGGGVVAVGGQQRSYIRSAADGNGQQAAWTRFQTTGVVSGVGHDRRRGQWYFRLRAVR